MTQTTDHIAIVNGDMVAARELVGGCQRLAHEVALRPAGRREHDAPKRPQRL
jgi:hypothetical protein